MRKQKNIPALRFPRFKGEWERKKLGAIALFFSGGTPLTSKRQYFNGDIPFIRSGEINQKITEQFLTEEGVKNSSAKMVSPGDILYALYGATSGEVAISKIKGAINQAVLCIKSTENNFFIASYLKFKKDNITNTFLQGGQGNLSAEIVKKIVLPFPTIPEQNHIAIFFTAIDKKVTELKQKKNLLEQYKKGLMQKLFSQELRFKDENGKAFPKWEKKRLRELGETYNGLSGKTKEHFGTGKPYVQYKQIFDDSKIDVSRFELVEIGEKENQNKVQFGDVFFTVSSETPNEIGTASVLLDNINELYLNSFCFGYRANSLDILYPYFSRYLFRNEIFRNEIVKLAQGSTRYNMSKVQLMKIEILLPSLAEQTKIANILTALDEKINHTQTQIEKTEQWKKGLLQQMFC